MLLTFTTEDIKNAPEAVRDWVESQITGFDNKPEKPSVIERAKAKKERKGKSEVVETPSEESPKDEPPKMSDVVEAAVNLIESEGEDALAEVLKKLGLARVKECPDERLAELLAGIATRAA